MVRLVGWRGLGLDPAAERRVQTLIERHRDRLESLLTEVVDLSVHVKQASKFGTKHRYDVNVTVMSEHGLFRAAKADWDLHTALHKTFESIEHQVEKEPWRTHLTDRFNSAEPLLRM
jgi:ribosome-associated translation inhibitor RaiA